MNKNLLAALLLTTLLFGGCAQVPQEAVVLSEDVAVILEELRQKNSSLITQLFSDRRARINTFVDTVYAPAIVKDAIERTNALERIANEVNNGDPNKALRMMEIVVRQSRQRIEKTRRELSAPVNAQERAVRDAFDEEERCE